jgi:hypothetical protein
LWRSVHLQLRAQPRWNPPVGLSADIERRIKARGLVPRWASMGAHSQYSGNNPARFGAPSRAIAMMLLGVLVLIVPRPAFGCVDPTPLYRSITIANVSVGIMIISATFAALLWYRRRRLALLAAVPGVLLLGHPRWTVSLWYGDCGFHMRALAIDAGIAALGALALFFPLVCLAPSLVPSTSSSCPAGVRQGFTGDRPMRFSRDGEIRRGRVLS